MPAGPTSVGCAGTQECNGSSALCQETLEPVIAVGVGANSVCAIVGGSPHATSGVVYCWGANEHCQVGGSNAVDAGVVATPTLVDTSGTTRPSPYSAASFFTQVVVGDSSACALDENGNVYCWGNGAGGEIGVRGFVGDDLCAQPGAGASASHAIQIVVTGVRFTQIAISHMPPTAAPMAQSDNYKVCGVTTDGDVYCWGAPTSSSSVVVKVWDHVTPPTSPPLMHVGATEVTIGNGHWCVLTDQHSIYCFGRLAAGQRGDGNASPSADDSSYASVPPMSGYAPGPVVDPLVVGPVMPIMDAVSIAAGDTYTCAARSGSGHGVVCWGYGSGLVTTDSSVVHATPVVITASSLPLVATSVVASAGVTCALTAPANEAYCWGDSYAGNQRATSAGQSFAAPVAFDNEAASPTAIRSISTAAVGYGAATTGNGAVGCVVAGPNARLYCWGANRYSQLADGTTLTRLAPVPALPGAAM